LDCNDLKRLVEQFKRIVFRQTGQYFPQTPRVQLDLAVRAVFESWDGDRARLYRRQEGIADDLGTAVNVCAMVFGNLGPDSGTGVAFTRDPATGAPGVYSDYLPNAQGEDVVAGIRDTMLLAELEALDKTSYDQLTAIVELLEQHYQDLCDIEFTIERGKLWMLQTRVGKRTAAAAFRIAAQLVDQGLIDLDEALRRVKGAQLAHLMFPRLAAWAERPRIASGIAASPGAAVGRVVFDSASAVKWSRSGERVILVRRETNPDDLDGMIAAEGVLTSRGGKTSHAAVVARGMGKTCVCGAKELEVDTVQRCFTAVGGHVVEEGDVISIDGSNGHVYLGEVPVAPSPVAEYFEGVGDQDGRERNGLVHAVERIMAHADGRRRLEVRANADNAEDASRARRYGALLGEQRRKEVERLILAADDRERQRALDTLLPMQRQDFLELFHAMDGLPVTVRLLDPPLHEFLPDLTALAVRVAVAEARNTPDENDLRLLEAVHRLHEQNPMLGLRGVRLGLISPGLFAMQVRAIAEAAAQLRLSGGDPRPEIMIPLVGTRRELEIVREDAEKVLAEVAAATGADLDVKIGTMIELPRAAVTAGRIAQAADFFSFGTNDLTQTVWGFSRDDVEASFFTDYLRMGVFEVSPFETIDRDGVGALIRCAVEAGRATRPDLKLGVCGEHGGDPDSVHFFHEQGLDYVSCSPFRIPVARLEAGRAVLMTADGGREGMR
jgi:pyruvate,orthophosphate dikinase